MKDEARLRRSRRAAGQPCQPAPLLGLGILEDKGVLRSHMKVFTSAGEGETTSGSRPHWRSRSPSHASRSPTQPAKAVEVDIRGKRLKARTVKVPYVTASPSSDPMSEGGHPAAPCSRPHIRPTGRTQQAFLHPPAPLPTGEHQSNVPSTLSIPKSHEWIRVEDDGTLTIGVTDHAQEAPATSSSSNCPKPAVLSAGEACAVIESVKAARHLRPVTGEVVANNQDAIDAPRRQQRRRLRRMAVQAKPANAADVAALMDAAAYEAEIAQA